MQVWLIRVVKKHSVRSQKHYTVLLACGPRQLQANPKASVLPKTLRGIETLLKLIPCTVTEWC